MKRALVKLARTIDWGFLEQTFGAVYTDKPGQPPLPTRLMAVAILLALAVVTRYLHHRGDTQRICADDPSASVCAR